MKKQFKFSASVLAAITVLALLLCGCGEVAPADTGTEQTEAVVQPAETTVEETTVNEAPADVDLGGYVFTVLCSDNSLWVAMHYSESGENGDVINDALYDRERIIEEKFNCSVEFVKNSSALEQIKKTYNTGDSICECAFMSGSDEISAAKAGAIKDLTGVEGLRLDKEWWDQRIQQEYKIGSRLFTIDGEINIRDDLRTMGFVYNKVLYESYGYNAEYGVPYTLVSEGKWSLETMLNMIKGKTTDPNDDNGTWGLLSEVAAPYAYFLGSGYKSVITENGNVVCKLSEESVYNALESMLNLSKNTDIMLANDGTHFVGGSVWDDVSAVFENGKALFRSTTISAVNRLLDMKDDYGILPIPNKGDSNEYYCFVSGSNNSPVCIPSTVSDLDKAATVIEAMAYYSYASSDGNIASLHEAFYALLGDARLARNYEDTSMLDIVFGSKTYDIDQVTDITGFESAFYNLVKAKNVTSLSSTVKGTLKTANKNIDKFVKGIEEKYSQS